VILQDVINIDVQGAGELARQLTRHRRLYLYMAIIFRSSI
jgi:hypothetical protein